MKHKFFERYLDNDLNGLTEYLAGLNQGIIDGKFPGISVEDAVEAQKSTCMATSLSPRYNLFQFENEYINNLFNAIRDMTIEACDYYDVDFKSQKYYLQGWFNYDEASDAPTGIDDLHDHCGGMGSPFFHGYYCVNAEPSVTHYQIDKKDMFENINKNNRAILSETGHPHRKGSWSSNEKRITIAYDMMPLKTLPPGFSQHWLPLA